VTSYKGGIHERTPNTTLLKRSISPILSTPILANYTTYSSPSRLLQTSDPAIHHLPLLYPASPHMVHSALSLVHIKNTPHHKAGQSTHPPAPQTFHRVRTHLLGWNKQRCDRFLFSQQLILIPMPTKNITITISPNRELVPPSPSLRLSFAFCVSVSISIRRKRSRSRSS